MSQKKSKRVRRVIRKEKKVIMQTLIREVQLFPFLERVKFAFFIIRGK